ncbi:MAG TPA: FliM/FliN family flagellar motor switch protein [Terriglobia bacterium]|nr:FliM/FliN family flagellar motor switch protein [Terriglobia bacterium]
MISGTPPATSDRTQDYLNAWTASVCDVLEKITGTAFTAIDLSPEEMIPEAGTLREEGVWLRFKVEKALKGEQSFGICKSDALRLAQILMGEPFNQTQDFSSEYQDALAELFRQFAGTAALVLKPRVGGEVNLELAGHDPGNWKPRVQRGVRLKSEGTAQFLLVILIDPDLGESLTSAPLGKAEQPPAAPIPSTRVAPAAASQGNRNIDLLFDVELQVALRFGKSEMPLGSILELSAGAVVELDQKILDPVELLVGGKVVAQGEVVVMDGHYALRVTEVLNPIERIESLQA